MTDPQVGDIVRYKNCTTHYKVIEKKNKLWISVIGSLSEFIMPPHGKLVLVSRPKISMDTSGFEALKAVSMDDTTERMPEALLGKYYGEKDILNKLKEENKMSISINSLVAKVTDNIKDAQLVTQYFGHELNEASIKDEYFIRDNYEDLLKEARAREEKKLANSEKSCA